MSATRLSWLSRPLVPALCALIAYGCPAVDGPALPAPSVGSLVQPLVRVDAAIGLWQGATLQPGAGLMGGDALALGDDGVAELVHADGPQGWVKRGFRTWHDGCFHWQSLSGLRLAVRTGGQPATVRVTLLPPNTAGVEAGVSATVAVSGTTDWQTLRLPWSAFVFDRARTVFVQNVRHVRIEVTGADGHPLSGVAIADVTAAVLEPVAVTAAVRGGSVAAGGTVSYQLELTNTTERPQATVLQVERVGWEAMTTTVTPDRLVLAPGEHRTCTVTVAVPERIPPGGNEEQTVRVIVEGDGERSQTVTFATASALTTPSIIHTPERWQHVRDTIATQTWAKEALAEYQKQAAAWQVPQPAHRDPGDTMGPYLFETKKIDSGLRACAYVWQLSGDRAAAEKVAEFMRRLSHPTTGYASTFRACHQAFVQEGELFQTIAMAYDAVRDANVLSAADHAQIAAAFRLFMETVDVGNQVGAINNWNLAQITGAFFCALSIQDIAAAKRFYFGANGIAEQLAKGTMDDGWWYECSISYNVWCTTEFTQAALAWLPWGIDVRESSFPANFSRDVMLAAPGGVTELNGGRVPKASDIATSLRGHAAQQNLKKPFGMDKELWGPVRRPARNLRMMWNSLLPFVDWRGVMFGVNDAAERQVGGEAFDIAYYVFRDPAYAAMVQRGKKRSLIYGVAELPKDAPELYRVSAHADNVGVAMLRSQTPDRPASEQIQAVLHYGTHGWAHGHFDRTNLLSLMRYGRSFYNPEMIWYSYEPYMYKFFVQTSMTKNMVVVDRKMQTPTESDLLTFRSGAMMQLAVVETNTTWSDPPYGGMVYDYVPVKTFAEKMWREGRSIPLADPQPGYGLLDRFSEKVLQRRAMIVTDDYVVLADRVQGGAEHTYDCLFQLKGFEGLDAAGKTWLRHDGQMDTDPRSAAQFITNCDWYAITAPATARFTMRFGKDADNDGCRTDYNVDGILGMDVHMVWPQRSEVMIGTQPESFPVEKQVTWAVRDGASGKTLADGKSGIWVLGAVPVDVPVANVDNLELSVSVASSKRDTLFWADARVVTAYGTEIPLNRLPMTTDNVLLPKDAGKDYYGGPIIIQGVAPGTAIPTQPATSADPRIKPKADDKKDYVPPDANVGNTPKPDVAKPALVRVDLRGVKAVRFKATLGGDFPLGDETQRRKALAVRSTGTTADFITVIEPHEGKRMVVSARAESADRLHVELADGRVQDIVLNGLASADGAVSAAITESRQGTIIRREIAEAGVPAR